MGYAPYKPDARAREFASHSVMAHRIPLLALRAWMERGSHTSPERERWDPVTVFPRA